MCSVLIRAKILLKLTLKETLLHEKISIKLNFVVQVIIGAQMTD